MGVSVGIDTAVKKDQKVRTKFKTLSMMLGMRGLFLLACMALLMFCLVTSKSVRAEGCQEPADCPGMLQFCDTQDGFCKYGCDEDSDCPEGEFCIFCINACYASQKSVKC